MSLVTAQSEDAVRPSAYEQVALGHAVSCINVGKYCWSESDLALEDEADSWALVFKWLQGRGYRVQQASTSSVILKILKCDAQLAASCRTTASGRNPS